MKALTYFYSILLLSILTIALSGCSTNPATYYANLTNNDSLSNKYINNVNTKITVDASIGLDYTYKITHVKHK